MRNLLTAIGLAVVKIAVGLLILSSLVYACGGMKCITLPDGQTHCMYCNCEGQCF
jgi:hypothetical protein